MSLVAEVGCSHITAFNKAIFLLVFAWSHAARSDGQARDGLSAVTLHACRSSPAVASSITSLPSVAQPTVVGCREHHGLLLLNTLSHLGSVPTCFSGQEKGDVMSFSDDLTTFGASTRHMCLLLIASAYIGLFFVSPHLLRGSGATFL